MSVTPPTPPDFPSPTDSPEDFDDKAYDCFPYVASAAANVYANAQAAETAAGESQDSADDSAASAAASEVSRQAADAASNYKGEWSGLTGALPKPATVSNDGAFWALNNSLANVALSEPAPGNADWTFVSGTRWVIYAASATLSKNSQNIIIATSAAADMAIPSGMGATEFTELVNSPASTQTVRLINNNYTIRGDNGSVSPGDNLILLPGERVHVLAVSPTVLEAT